MEEKYIFRNCTSFSLKKTSFNISFGASSLTLTQKLRESEEHFSSSLIYKFFLHYLFSSPYLILNIKLAYLF